MFCEVFDNLPIAAIVNGRYLTMHGGITERMTSLDDINRIPRRLEPTDDTMLNDILWADPIAESQAKSVAYTPNNSRSTSYKFGLKPLKKLLKEQRLDALIRAHEVQQDGYKF